MNKFADYGAALPRYLILIDINVLREALDLREAFLRSQALSSKP
jgi:hypothetical protein